MEETVWSVFCSDFSSSRNDGTKCSSSSTVPAILNPESCINHVLILSIDILFLLTIFSIFVKLKFSSKNHPPQQTRKQLSITWMISVIFNAVLGLVYLGLGVWMVFEKILKHKSVFPMHEWIVMVFQGITWLFLSVLVCLKSQHKMVKISSLLVFLVSACQSCSSIWEVIANSMLSITLVLDILILPGSVLLLLCVFRRNDGETVPDFGAELPYEALSGEGDDVTPFENAGFFSTMSFWWLNPIMKKGNDKIIEDDDIPRLRYSDRAETCYAMFMEQLRTQKREGSDSPSLFFVLLSCHKRELLISGFFALIKVLALLSGPLLLKGFIQVAGDKSGLRFQGYALTVTLFVVKCLESVSGRQWYFRARLIEIQVRSMLSAAIYWKQLHLSNVAKGVHSSGEIVNYVTIDAYKLGEFPYWFHQSWTTCLQLCLATFIAVETVGLATVAAWVGIVLTMIVSSPLAKLQLTCHTKLVQQQDKRLKALSEALANMKVLKLYAWETHFRKAIEGLRKNELWTVLALLFHKGCHVVVFWSSPIVVSGLTFWTCYFLGVEINATNVFTFLAILRCIQEPIRMIPDIATEFVEAKVSLHRIARFLESPELENRSVRVQRQDPESNLAIMIKCGGISWDSDPSSYCTLTDINLVIKPGEKVAICGEVGSGKSTLLSTVLGEVPKINGTVRVYGKLAYVSQNAWMQTGTIQENILFGSAMDPIRYDDVLKRCSLVKDLNMLPYGDLTEIGERGVNLSGGQKQRVQLARALYQNADVYLLDDPFSAVDAHTAARLFNEYVMEALAGKTVLLVTHQVDFLPEFDCILLLSSGKILRAGTYDQLIASCQQFQELVNAHNDTVSSERITENDCTSTTRGSIEEIQKVYGKEQRKAAAAGDQLIMKEEREAGDTGFKPYKQYLCHGKGYLYCFLSVGSYFVFVVGQLVQNYLLAAEIQNYRVSRVKLFAVYCVIGCILAVFLVLRSVFLVKLSFEASVSIFSKLLCALFRAPMSFYDSTPLGRILSRVSYDLSVVDLEVATKISVAIGSTLNAYCTLGLLAFLSWPLLFIIVPMVYLLTILQRYYFNAAKEFMRITGTTKSTVISHLSESISGSITIRAFAEEDRFFSKYLKLIDRNASPHFHSFSANEWLIERLEIPCAIVLSASALTLILMPLGSSGPGFVGMALSYGLALNMFFMIAVQYQCFISESIISVERLEQYMNIRSEAPEIIERNRPSQDWPTSGKIEFCDLKVRYQAKSPLVLHGISCVIEGGHKVGIVGRTGSGKTTLTSALFRLVEPAEGRVIIDGIDISTIGLHDLRSHIGIIPQDPTLFNGSVRYNLDPLSQHTDSEIWKVLEKCQLRTVIEQKKNGLRALVAQDGSNWSMGQRQLFCLGRALLKRSRILVLDEATASIDNATDAILQRTIRTEFAECTVITVAHRIPTVMDCTKVLALSDGKMIEYDEPATLMKMEDSLFARLVKEYWFHAANHDI